MMDWDAKARAQLSRPGDLAQDFCLWPYDPPRAPSDDALRSVALLYKSFDGAGLGPEMAALTDAIRDTWGRFATVWGMKWSAAGPSWEFYFYDYARAHRRLGIGDFLKATAPWLNCALTPDDSLPYFMFSVEIASQHLAGAPLDQIDIYMGNPGSNVSSGICYGLTQAGYEMRNFYFFFDAQREAQQIHDKLTESIYLPLAKVNVTDLLWPEMAGVQTVVVANKQRRDGLYFSRIRAAQLAHFLQKQDFPAALQGFLAENHDALDHHLYDVGWDFACDADGRVHPVKGSFYGLL
ncbi:hypothetical protein [Yoonia vestfoldensis]|uniref:hypothetical protein n=1 Tax=Yoonia vestfoldensis TaxID=245188 RepID=UPI0003A05C9C|nr:hypothetical protein [Yoonia vestfoldensis]